MHITHAISVVEDEDDNEQETANVSCTSTLYISGVDVVLLTSNGRH